jgi:hypothetical protein
MNADIEKDVHNSALYKEVELINSKSTPNSLKFAVIIPFNEKPGIEAISMKSEKHASFTLDCGYFNAICNSISGIGKCN